MQMKKVSTVDEYIKTLPGETQAIMEKIRKTIKSVAKGAEEKISYGMPAFRYDGKMLIYYAAWQKHIGLYAASTAIKKKFAKELKPYKVSKGTIQFQLDEKIPYDLIKKIAEFRVKENESIRAKKK